MKTPILFLLCAASAALWLAGANPASAQTPASQSEFIPLGTLTFIPAAIAALPDGALVVDDSQLPLSRLWELDGSQLPLSWLYNYVYDNLAYYLEGRNIAGIFMHDGAICDEATGSYYIHGYGEWIMEDPNPIYTPLGYFDNDAYPALATAILSDLRNGGVLNAEQIALLPAEWNAQQTISDLTSQYAADPLFSASITCRLSPWMDPDSLTYVDDPGVYEFDVSYTCSANTPAPLNSGDFGYITGGPPAEVYYGQTFPVNVTLQAWSCENAAILLNAVTTSPPSSANTAAPSAVQSQTAEQYLSSVDDTQFLRGHGFYWTDAQDVYLGDFVAPTRSDIAGSTTSSGTTTVTTYGQEDPNAKFEVSANFQSASYYLGVEFQNGSITHQGTHWTVKLVNKSPPRTVNVTATAQPKPGYGAWFKPSAPATTTVTVP